MRFLSWIIVLCFICTPAAQASTIEQQRDWFQQARKALDAQQTDVFVTLKKKLVDYPLTPYLDIWQAREQLRNGVDNKVAATLKKFADIPESHDLRIAWIKYLSKHGHWSQVAKQLKSHPGLTHRLPEITMMANWRTGKKNAAMKQFSDRWRNADSLTDISKSLYQVWLKQGHPNRPERWSRLILLIRNGQWKESRTLGTVLGKQQKQWLSYWRDLQGDPQSVFLRWPSSLSPQSLRDAPQGTALSKAIIRDGLKRLAVKDPLLAHTSLQNLKKRVHFGAKDTFYGSIEKKIALRAAKRHMSIAAQWLGDLPARQRNKETRAWQARLFMIQHHWAKMLQVIHAMPHAQQQQSRWQYWQAYALQAGGEMQQATAIFTGLAAGRGYYSFLGAERAHLPYHFGNEPAKSSPALIRQLARRPGIKRAREWLALDSYGKARREWSAALAGSSAKIWNAALMLASRWGWPRQAIYAASRAGKVNALEERFPLQYERNVMLAAKETGLSPSSIWSIIRQESAFNQQALSRAGAKGLMQLMPKTARMVAKQVKLSSKHPNLFSPEINIRLGSRYLADMKTRFNENLVLAAAAYNAGPNRVSQWLDRTPFDIAEIWVEAIPYNETRRYVQQAMAFTTVYEWRRQQQPGSLSARMNTRYHDLSLNK